MLLTASRVTHMSATLLCELVADGQVCTFAHLDAGTLRTALLFEK